MTTPKPPTTRQMKVKILYTFDTTHDHPFLARSSTPISIRLLNDTPGRTLDTPLVGLVDLRTCISAVCSASPELIANGPNAADYTVYTTDYTEMDAPFLGQGMLSWILGSPEAAERHYVTGRVIGAGPIYGAGEVLEVKLKLYKVAGATQGEFLTAMRTYDAISKALPKSFDVQAWTASLKGLAVDVQTQLRQLAEMTPPAEEFAPTKRSLSRASSTAGGRKASLLASGKRVAPQQVHERSVAASSPAASSPSFTPVLPNAHPMLGSSPPPMPGMPLSTSNLSDWQTQRGASSPILPSMPMAPPASASASMVRKASMHSVAGSTSGRKVTMKMDPAKGHAVVVITGEDDQEEQSRKRGPSGPMSEPAPVTKKRKKETAPRKKDMRGRDRVQANNAARLAAVQAGNPTFMGPGQTQTTLSGKICQHCGTNQTAAWRKVNCAFEALEESQRFNNDGKDRREMLLCNPCGVFYTTRKRMRPEELWDRPKGTASAESKARRPKAAKKAPKDSLKRSMSSPPRPLGATDGVFGNDDLGLTTVEEDRMSSTGREALSDIGIGNAPIDMGEWLNMSPMKFSPAKGKENRPSTPEASARRNIDDFLKTPTRSTGSFQSPTVAPTPSPWKSSIFNLLDSKEAPPKPLGFEIVGGVEMTPRSKAALGNMLSQAGMEDMIPQPNFGAGTGTSPQTDILPSSPPPGLFCDDDGTTALTSWGEGSEVDTPCNTAAAANAGKVQTVDGLNRMQVNFDDFFGGQGELGLA
ncbi:hypothetical protein SAICODRAFT_69727 [Saitoella complicata NRRL Y-17804]|uniref:GATA-type domain-containing protein n=1 Tax=Saitoella complicata (strain BCRC 22490 / CBS 7301 / JCM 7358 / NBRC 10748 / NRRL Y-17804) TaxID=698492 RepID=A0A0E9NJK2_SAICN|nr:uncharacterized protein SAICODRAFT_69727 [Saitoella complicata NRRL Y-17804]ODQ55112.1 hypothetical protein SAICODRAFT_69727 [Saitoella complicata NRRL Y-17804]GAO50024.1 hypothetical protein G7K_4159-t1 [Saitoella complicata NRRL Y-17804]